MTAQDSETQPPKVHRALCPVFLVVGVLCTGLGLLGMVVPGMPTTIFLIIALWAFSRSSDRLRRWLWTHRRFGPVLQAWHRHGVIPPRAKTAAVAMMICSVAVITWAVTGHWLLPVAVAAVMAPVACWIVTRRSHPPAPAAQTR